MRTIDFNGYIDESVWFGDEITPEMLHERLYDGTDANVLMRLNSYGGLCSAAVRMYDMIKEYPGTVDVMVSGVAASAATVVASAGHTVSMTPGSLYMIHNPLTFAYGNEHDFTEAIQLLRACKESIVNIYELRTKLARQLLSDLMDATTWLDAKAAMERGFIDEIVGQPEDSGAARVINRADAEKKVQVWIDRRNPNKASRPDMGDDHTSTVALENKAIEPIQQDGMLPQPEERKQEEPGTPIAQLEKRLGLIMPTNKRRNPL